MAQKIYIYGKHAVREALTHARGSVLKVLTSPKLDDPELKRAIAQAGVATDRIDERTITSQVEGRGAHQGVVALVSLGQLAVPFEQWAEQVRPAANTLVVFLSGVEDPHNTGTLIRSAAAFGAVAVVMPTHKQSPITGAVVKASVGMAFRIPLVLADNAQQALATLKKKGFRIYGLDMGGTPVGQEHFDAPTVLVLGNEGEGLPPFAKALCDSTLSIPMDPRAESLNVSAAGAVAMYAWRQQVDK